MLLARNAVWNETFRLAMNASFAIAYRFVATAVSDSLPYLKGGVSGGLNGAITGRILGGK